MQTMSEEAQDAADIGTDELLEEVRQMDAADGVEHATPTPKNTVVVALSRLVTLEAEHQDLADRVNELERRQL
jgi:hypothetical protein